jgi:DNA repair photolyase
MQPIQPTIKGRGTAVNPPNRFVPFHVEVDPDAYVDEEKPAPATVYFEDHARTIIASNDSPDVSFDFSINPYRGCTHGCCYCFARPGHEFLGFSAGLDFETKIMVKSHAADLLRAEFSNPKFKAVRLAISGVTDCYQPIERKLELTRKILQVCAEFHNPVTLITKRRRFLRGERRSR